MTTPAIAIIGGGPCGLTLARLLECKGIDYTVFERDASANSNRAGGSLDIHAHTGQHALREGGLIDEFKKYARYEDAVMSLADKHGKKVFEMGQGRDDPEIDRAELRQILLDAVPKDKIKWGHVLQSVAVGEDKRPVIRFSNGTEISSFKLVVGADGAWSKVRSVITQATPKYSSKTYLESRIGLENPLYQTVASNVGAGSSLAIGSGKLIVTQRQGNGSYRIYFGFEIPENYYRDGTVNLQDIEATRRWLLTNFYADWSEEYQDFIRHATDFRAWPLYSLATEDMGWKSVPGFTLAGDAAHVSIPNGEGVNLAMADSLTLANKIEEHGLEDLDKAVQEYEADMFPRGISSICDGKRWAEVMYSDDPQAFVKLITSLMPDE